MLLLIPLTRITRRLSNILAGDSHSLYKSYSEETTKTARFKPHSSIIQLTCGYFVDFPVLIRVKWAPIAASRPVCLKASLMWARLTDEVYSFRDVAFNGPLIMKNRQLIVDSKKRTLTRQKSRELNIRLIRLKSSTCTTLLFFQSFTILISSDLKLHKQKEISSLHRFIAEIIRFCCKTWQESGKKTKHIRPCLPGTNIAIQPPKPPECKGCYRYRIFDTIDIDISKRYR